MKAKINNEYTITLGEQARLSQISKDYTFIRIKKGTFADIELVRAASLGHFEMDDQGAEWRLSIKTSKIEWED